MLNPAGSLLTGPKHNDRNYGFLGSPLLEHHCTPMLFLRGGGGGAGHLLMGALTEKPKP